MPEQDAGAYRIIPASCSEFSVQSALRGCIAELNPVRAAMVTAPEDYRWSSVHTHLGTACDPLITLHPVNLALAHTFAERIAAYREWLQAGIGEDDLKTIRNHLEQERALGSERFQKMVEKTLNRPAICRPRGRPRARAS